jgi:hypothetical protein
MTTSRIGRMRRDLLVNHPGKLMVVTVMAIAAGTLLAVTSMTSPELTASQKDLPAQAASSPATDFVYFPSQYSNQATEPSEHTQAF